MQRMFRSATLKLTAWYLLILVVISVVFSAVIYQFNYREISFRLESFQDNLIQRSAPNEQDYLATLFESPVNPMKNELRQAAAQMTISLIYLNVILLGASGVGAYFLARRTLRPIEDAHEAQSRFTSDASHELRTPLSAMKTELEVNLRDTALTNEEARELLESNLEEVNKLIQLSEMLLQLSRLDHNKLEQTSVTLSDAVQSALKSFDEKSKKRLKKMLRKKTIIHANEPAIIELVTILVDNALKYSPKGSTVTIRSYEKRGQAHLSVHNTGDPIPESALPRLFERFFRADTSRTDSSKNGYGLGLSIAKKIADVHHAELRVESGKNGTTFTYITPVKRRGL